MKKLWTPIQSFSVIQRSIFILNFDFLKKFEPNQKIYQICFFTAYTQLRDYLANVLVERRNLNESELDMVGFLKKVELAYPCRSFEHAKLNLIKFR